MKCQKSCPKTLECGHKCKSICWKNCPPCSTLVIKELPCKHTAQIKCSVIPEQYHCNEPCSRGPLPCGHTCKEACGNDCVCSERLKMKMPCGHEVEYNCGQTPLCKIQCKQLLACGHECVGTWFVILILIDELVLLVSQVSIKAVRYPATRRLFVVTAATRNVVKIVASVNRNVDEGT
jgi:hypothetical protein